MDSQRKRWMCVVDGLGKDMADWLWMGQMCIYELLRLQLLSSVSLGKNY